MIGESGRYSVGSTQVLSTVLRSLLRFRHATGALDRELAARSFRWPEALPHWREGLAAPLPPHAGHWIHLRCGLRAHTHPVRLTASLVNHLPAMHRKVHIDAVLPRGLLDPRARPVSPARLAWRVGLSRTLPQPEGRPVAGLGVTAPSCATVSTCGPDGPPSPLGPSSRPGRARPLPAPSARRCPPPP